MNISKEHEIDRSPPSSVEDVKGRVPLLLVHLHGIMLKLNTGTLLPSNTRLGYWKGMEFTRG
jgi:hypothetical protein